MSIELKVPSVGESITEVFIGSWLVKEGESVERDAPVVELESEKTTVELPAPETGVLSKVLKKEGDSAKVGEVIGYLDEPGKEAKKDKDEVKEKKKKSEVAEAKDNEQSDPNHTKVVMPLPEATEEDDEHYTPPPPAEAYKDTEEQEVRLEDSDDVGLDVKPRIMPATRRAMQEHGVSDKEVKGTGPGGRILKEDVMRAVDRSQKGDESRARRESLPRQSRPSPPSSSPNRKEGEREEEVVPMSPMRRRIAENLVASQHNAALLTTFNEIDVTNIMELRKKYNKRFQERYGLKLGIMSFFVKATVNALQLVPQVNAEIREQSIVYKKYYDIGIAVGGGKGLVVPVLRDADRMSFADIEAQIVDFANRAREMKLKIEELQGGTFTISNGGIYGSLLSTPIVNPPQCGILGMHVIQDRPVAIDGQIEIRPMMYVALTYDHRNIDGREAVTFLKRIKECIEEPSRIFLEI